MLKSKTTIFCISRMCSNNENKIDSCLRRNDDHNCHSREGGNPGFIFFSKLQLLETQIIILFLLLLIFYNRWACPLYSRELSPTLRKAEHLFNSGSLNSAREIAMKVHKNFPRDFQALLILMKIDFKNENYKSAKKWLKIAYSINRSHPLVKLYITLLRDIEHRFGAIPSNTIIVSKNKSQMESARDFHRAWFGPNFPVLSEPSTKHRIEKTKPALALGLPKVSREDIPEEITVCNIASNAIKQKKYMKAYLFFSQLLESNTKNRKYRIGKAESAFHMKRYREVVEILGPSIALSPKTYTKKQIKKANELLKESRKHVYRKGI